MASTLRSVQLRVTTNASGVGSVTLPDAILGLLYMVKWKDGDFDDGVDAVLSVAAHGDAPARTLLTLTNANDDAEYLTRVQGSGNTGSVIAGVYDYPIIDGRLTLTIAQGGNVKTGGGGVYIIENA